MKLPATVAPFWPAIDGMFVHETTMPDELKPLRNASRSATLALVAESLGLPVSCFYGAMLAEHRTGFDDEPLLRLIKAHLQAANPEARRRFVEAVRTIADEPLR